MASIKVKLCSFPLCRKPRTDANYCPEHQTCGYTISYDAFDLPIYCNKPAPTNHVCVAHKCSIPVCPNKKPTLSDKYCGLHAAHPAAPVQAPKRPEHELAVPLRVKRLRFVKKDFGEDTPASPHLKDNRVHGLPGAEDRLRGFWCQCGGVVPLAVLPKSLSVHRDFRCGDCKAESRCLVCNKRAANPFAMPPFETRTQELEMYYCKEHLEAAAPDPFWEKQFLRVPDGAKPDEYCHSCAKDFRKGGISVIRGGAHLPQVAPETPWCNDCVRAADSRLPE